MHQGTRAPLGGDGLATDPPPGGEGIDVYRLVRPEVLFTGFRGLRDNFLNQILKAGGIAFRGEGAQPLQIDYVQCATIQIRTKLGENQVPADLHV